MNYTYTKGVNLSPIGPPPDGLNLAGARRQWPDSDLTALAAGGFDFSRLIYNPDNAMYDDGTIKTSYMNAILDHARRSVRAGIAVILAPFEGRITPTGWESGYPGDTFAHWNSPGKFLAFQSNLAAMLANDLVLNPNTTMIETANEPHLIDETIWREKIQPQIVGAIRRKAPNHPIALSPGRYHHPFAFKGFQDNIRDPKSRWTIHVYGPWEMQVELATLQSTMPQTGRLHLKTKWPMTDAEILAYFRQKNPQETEDQLQSHLRWDSWGEGDLHPFDKAAYTRLISVPVDWSRKNGANILITETNGPCCRSHVLDDASENTLLNLMNDYATTNQKLGLGYAVFMTEEVFATDLPGARRFDLKRLAAFSGVLNSRYGIAAESTLGLDSGAASGV